MKTGTETNDKNYVSGRQNLAQKNDTHKIHTKGLLSSFDKWSDQTPHKHMFVKYNTFSISNVFIKF